MRLDLAKLSGVEKPQATQSVLVAALKERFQARLLFLAHCHHNFAADFMRNGMALAELDHLADAADGEARAARSRLVIEAAVEHAAVVAALMPGHPRFFLENRHAGAGKALE